jgi:hypothetical protein
MMCTLGVYYVTVEVLEVHFELGKKYRTAVCFILLKLHIVILLKLHITTI